MRHKVKIEEIIRESDGASFTRVTLHDLAGSDLFSVECTGENPKEALLALAHRMRLISDDAADVAGMLFDQAWVPELTDTNSSSSRGMPILRLVPSEEDLLKGDEEKGT